jgi:parallel beta-helix repeat protein
VLFSLSTVNATTWYVHPDSALNTIQAGLDSCADNDTVLVGAGTYYENIIWPNIQGIALTSESGPATAIIDGDSAESVITISIYAFLDTTAKIDGFTIRNGSSYFGGGIRCQGSSIHIIIRNNIIANNSATFGGGISLLHSNPLIKDNTITENSANVSGGIYCFGCGPTISDNIIMGNTGSGINCEEESSPTITGNTISNNTEGGIGCDEITAPSITNNIITGNDWFGILAIDASPSIHNCVISNNSGDGVLYSYGMKCSKGRALSISHSDIIDNVGYGVRNYDSTLVISAENNWWGDSSGPSGIGSGSGDEVSDWVNYEPWLFAPFGIEEQPIVKPTANHIAIRATIFSGHLQLPKDKKCKIFDITGRVVEPSKIQPGIYFVEIDDKVVQKVIRVW